MTITIYLYNLGWGQLNFGRAAAVAWLLFLIIVLIGLFNLAITRSIAASSDITTASRKPRAFQPPKEKVTA
jgi:cellobiose transport system permease protein